MPIGAPRPRAPSAGAASRAGRCDSAARDPHRRSAAWRRRRRRYCRRRRTLCLRPRLLEMMAPTVRIVFLGKDAFEREAQCRLGRIDDRRHRSRRGLLGGLAEQMRVRQRTVVARRRRGADVDSGAVPPPMVGVEPGTRAQVSVASWYAIAMTRTAVTTGGRYRLTAVNHCSGGWSLQSASRLATSITMARRPGGLRLGQA